MLGFILLPQHKQQNLIVTYNIPNFSKNQAFSIKNTQNYYKYEKDAAVDVH